MKPKDNFPVFGIQEFQPDLHHTNELQFHLVQGKQLIEKPHKHDFFMLLLFEQGSGTHTIDFKQYEVGDHQLHLLFPGQVHSWALGENTVAYQLMISQPVFEIFSSSLELTFVLYQKQPVLELSSETFSQLQHEFQSIDAELSRAPVHWNIVNLRNQLIAQLVNREAGEKYDYLKVYRAVPALMKYQHLVDVYFKEQKSVAFYADQLHISANYLNILCKRNLQVPALFLIHTRIILEAKRLLHASELPVKEIAFDLGFSDLAHFSNFFKSKTGMSPRSFREQL
ncbi:helix-turn-helix transcriptional regulator [Pontibacter sp. BT731]|uniref:AraC family transcriptional regulator n=1 Tax=Pontibacter coccineus TaxID=3063328 RepID=UPI0026E2440D|nr:helix-turn-helix domain-containing protein [Pontibacter sp. BT731]MDO6388585.1 helix-turn-helix transcriptional regulator [Pontibacter sp. BT731]